MENGPFPIKWIHTIFECKYILDLEILDKKTQLISDPRTQPELTLVDRMLESKWKWTDFKSSNAYNLSVEEKKSKII